MKKDAAHPDEQPVKIEQKVLDKDTADGLRLFFYTLNIISLLSMAFLNKILKEDKEIWIYITASSLFCLMIVLSVYHNYATNPSNQKKLKALIDAITVLLALLTLIFTYVTAIYLGKGGNFIESVIHTNIGIVAMGVISGVMIAKMLIPFWDIYSPYRKI
ncbi:hypothetical protein [Mixta calida]|uniref:hypothetical protein n=1 Tax=Mixta calida TaxID=665913 RepID=UPI002899943B|nr:hypothetical protein [Mixta calida]